MKQEQKNKALLISLIVLLCVTVTVVFFNTDGERPAIDKDLFRVENLRGIDRITLQSPLDTIEISYKESRWVVNNVYPADQRMIQVLFATLQQVEPQRPIASNQKDSIATLLDKGGVKVSLYARQELQKSFVAGGNKQKTRAYFKTGDEIYLVNIPGYRVYVSGVFELNTAGFRDKFVFGFNWQNFKSLKAEFPGRPSESFEVAMSKDFFTIKGMADADTSKLNTFLDNVSLLTVEDYLADSVGENLSKGENILNLVIEDVAQRQYELQLFHIEGNTNFYGLIGGEAVTFTRETINPVLRPRSYFAKKSR